MFPHVFSKKCTGLFFTEHTLKIFSFKDIKLNFLSAYPAHITCFSCSYYNFHISTFQDINKNPRFASGIKLLNYSAELSVEVVDDVASVDVSEEVALVSEVVLLVSDVVDDVELLVVEDVTLLVVEDVTLLVVEDVLPRLAKLPLYITMKLATRATIKNVKAAVFVSLLSLASLDLPAFF